MYDVVDYTKLWCNTHNTAHLLSLVESHSSPASIRQFILQGCNPCTAPVLPLCRAVQLGQFDIVLTILSCLQDYGRLHPTEYVSVNARDRFGRNPLHYAAEIGCTEMMCLLLGAGCDVNSLDNENLSPLHLACCHGNACLIRLLQAGANPNVKASQIYDSVYPIHLAARQEGQSLQYLLQYQADPTVLCAGQKSPLSTAIDAQVLANVQILVKYLTSETNRTFEISCLFSLLECSDASIIRAASKYIGSLVLNNWGKIDENLKETINFAFESNLNAEKAVILMDSGFPIRKLFTGFLPWAMQKPRRFFQRVFGTDPNILTLTERQQMLDYIFSSKNENYKERQIADFSCKLRLLIRKGLTIDEKYVNGEYLNLYELRVLIGLGVNPVHLIGPVQYLVQIPILNRIFNDFQPDVENIYSIAELFSQSGVSFMHLYDREKHRLFFDQNSMLDEEAAYFMDYLLELNNYFASNPLPLMYLARLIVRKMLIDCSRDRFNDVYELIDLLSLPTHIKNLLKFQS